MKGKDPRVALADWLTSKDNTMFRENMANRIWAHFIGRGIVDPVDDVRISNPPSNKELLEALGKHSGGLQLRHEEADPRHLHLAHLPAFLRPQRLQPRRRLLLLSRQAAPPARRRPARFDLFGDRHHHRVWRRADRIRSALQLYEGNRRSNNYFLKTFGISSRDSVNVSETRLEPTLAQTLHLINGDTLEGKINRSTVVA